MENPTPNFPKFGDLWMKNPTPDSSRVPSEDGALTTPAQFVSGVDETCGSTDVGPPACNQRDSGPWAFDELKGGLRLRGLSSTRSLTAQVDPPPASRLVFVVCCRPS